MVEALEVGGCCVPGAAGAVLVDFSAAEFGDLSCVGHFGVQLQVVLGQFL